MTGRVAVGDGPPIEIHAGLPCWIVALVRDEGMRALCTVHHHNREGAARFAAMLGNGTGEARMALLELKSCHHPPLDGLDCWLLYQEPGWPGGAN